MPRPLPWIVLLLAAVPAAVAQYPRLRETAEPPLADETGTVLAASAREPRPLAPGVRWTDAPAPVVLLQVRVPPVLPVGREVEVRLLVENAGRMPAKNVAVFYPLPAGVNLVKATPETQPAQGGYCAWTIPALAAGERKEIVLTVQPPPNAADFESHGVVRVEYEQTAKTRFAQPELKVRKTGPERALCHDILVFGMEVTNSGLLELTDVTLTDELPDGLKHRPDEVKDKPYKGAAAAPAILDAADGKARTWKVGRLAPGQSRRVEYYVEAVATQAVPIDHKAVAQAAGGARAEATAKVTLGEPKLEVKAEAPPRLPANQPARVRLRLANRGPKTLTNVVVTDEIPDPCRIENVTGGGQQFGSRVQWIVPALPANEERILELTVRQTEGGVVRHKITATYRGLTQQALTGTEFDAAAALAWDFRGAPATVEVNGEVTYAVTVQNTGTKAAANVRPVVELPPELQLLKAEPKEHKLEGPRVVFDPVTLPPDGKATYMIRARAVKASVGAQVLAELGADLYPSGALKRHEVTAIGGSAPAPPAAPPVGPMPNPVPVPPPPPG